MVRANTSPSRCVTSTQTGVAGGDAQQPGAGGAVQQQGVAVPRARERAAPADVRHGPRRRGRAAPRRGPRAGTARSVTWRCASRRIRVASSTARSSAADMRTPCHGPARRAGAERAGWPGDPGRRHGSSGPSPAPSWSAPACTGCRCRCRWTGCAPSTSTSSRPTTGSPASTAAGRSRRPATRSRTPCGPRSPGRGHHAASSSPTCTATTTRRPSRVRKELGLATVDLGIGEKPTLDLFNGGDLDADPTVDRLRLAGAHDLADQWQAMFEGRDLDLDIWALPDRWLDGRAARSRSATARCGRSRRRATPRVTSSSSTRRPGCSSPATTCCRTSPRRSASSSSTSHNPLADFLDSLELVRRLPDLRLLPAHGPVTDSAHARVDELLAHHDHRLDLCRAAVAVGCAHGVRRRPRADLDPPRAAPSATSTSSTARWP